MSATVSCQACQLAGIALQLQRKAVRNLNLRVLPPEGQVRLSVPLRLPLAVAEAFVARKRDWILHQQQRLRQQSQPPADLGDLGDTALLWHWGIAHQLQRSASSALPLGLPHACPPQSAEHSALPQLRLPTTWDLAQLQRWQAEQVRQALLPLLQPWQQRLQVQLRQFSIRTMRSRWGSCTPARASIRLNSALASYPPVCLEYVLVHELAHLLEPSHNARFCALLDQFLPDWRSCRAQLRQPRPLPRLTPPA